MPIWKSKKTLAQLNRLSEGTLQAHLDIEIIEIGDDYLKSSMPVDWRTHQPHGVLHGGASVVLAEATGSLAAEMCCETGKRCVGLNINANHIRSVAAGKVYGLATPAHLGRSTQVWDISITDEQNRIVCVSRLTMAVLDS